MAVYQDLLDAIARVRAGTGDDDAWMRGLSGTDLAVAANLVAVRTPGAIDAVLAKIRAGHPDLFGLPTAAPEIPGERQSAGDHGAAADAIRAAETALAQQKSATAQLDLQVITAVLNAHASDVAAGTALDALQRDVETAVAARTDLDTPAGAREFQRYLTGKLRDIRTVVETAGLDATSKAALTAALASLYAATPTDDTDQPNAPQPPAVPAGPIDSGAVPGDEAPVDDLLGADPGPDFGAAPVAGSPVPMMPAVPPFPAMGGGSPGPSAPLGGGWGSAPGGLPLPNLGGIGPSSADEIGHDVPENLPEPDDPPVDPPAEPESDHPDDDGDTDAEPGGDQENTVQLPGGETVTAGSPELADAITAAVAGTPIAEAFAQQGITIPAPGSPVTDPVDADRLVAGDVGILADRHALALGNGTALLNDRIRPVASVTGPDFLGWEHPPAPDPTAPPSTSDAPTPTRPAVTAGPSG